MAERPYDAIVVGARCAGSPTAMLLARRGHRVLLVDRARFPSDTLSTHFVHPPGVAALRRWGLLDGVVASGCPPIDTYAFDLGPFTLTGAPGTDESPVAYAPRRTVLDKILVDAAAAAGAEVREGFTVSEVVVEDGRVTGIRGHGSGEPAVTEHATVVIGADGLRSPVARAVRPEQYHEKPRLLCLYYSYWSGFPIGGRFETYLRPDRGFAAWPTNDDLTLVVGGWPFAEFETNRRDIEGHYLAMFELAPEFAARLRGATRVERLAGTAVPNFLRKPYGPGWALVGDAGYLKDPITGHGIHDAFRDAELCATALDQVFSGARRFEEAMGGYHRTRDEHVVPFFDLTTDIATLEPPPPDVQMILGAAHGNQDAMDGFARVNAGVTSPADYYSEENVGRILAAAGKATAAG